jgi:hypothetical protein
VIIPVGLVKRIDPAVNPVRRVWLRVVVLETVRLVMVLVARFVVPPTVRLPAMVLAAVELVRESDPPVKAPTPML